MQYGGQNQQDTAKLRKKTTPLVSIKNNGEYYQASTASLIEQKNDTVSSIGAVAANSIIENTSKTVIIDEDSGIVVDSNSTQ